MNRALSAAAKAALAIALFGGASQTVVALPSAVLASKQYRVKVTKKTFVYNAKGKKTKKYYKKNASLKAFGTKTIKGKKYYILGKGRYIRTSGAKKAGETKYRYGAQTKKISRTIKMYTPKGVKKVVQKAYIKRTVKTNLKTKKKTYGKWSTAVWKKYKPVKFKGYTASKETVKAAKVTSKTKNKTVKITYKLVKKTAPKKTNTKPATKPSTTSSKPANSGSASASSSNKPATKPSQPASTGGNSHSGNATTPSQPTNTSNTGNTNGDSTNTGSTAPSQPTNGGASTNTPSQPTNSGNTGNSGNTTPNQPTNGGNSNTGNSGTTAPSQPTNSSNTGNTNSGFGATAPSQPTNSGNTGSGSTAPSQPVSGNTGNANSSSGTTAPSQPASKPSQPTNSGSTNTGSGTTTPSQPTNGGSTNTGSTGNAGTSQPVQPQKPASGNIGNTGNTGNTNSGSGSTAPSQPAEPVKTAPADKVTTANVAYRTVYQAYPSMDAGTKKTLQAGQTGVDTTTTSYNVDGSVKSTSTVRTKNPVDQVISVGTKSVVKTETVAYQTVKKNDDSLTKGATKVVTKGVNGSKTTTTTYSLNTQTGEVAASTSVKTVDPVNEVVAVGTKEVAKPIAPTIPSKTPEDKVTTKAVSYKTIYQADPSAEAGTKKTVTAGQAGVDTTTVKYNNDGSVKSSTTVRTKNLVDEVVAVGTKSVVKSEVVPYSTVKKEDASLAKGSTKIITNGVNGSKTTTTTYTLNASTGEVIGNTDVKTVDPVNEVVAVGTKVVPGNKVTTKDVAFKTVYQADPSMDAGTKKVVTSGVNGVDTTTTTYNLDGSVKSSSTVRTKNPVDQVVAVGTKTKVSTEMIAYKYIEKADPTLAKGEEKLISAGHNGEKITTTTYTLDTATGLVTPHVDVKTTNPVDAILAVGTKEAEKPAEPTAPADKVTTAEVAYKTVYQADPSMAAGTKKVLTSGQTGVDTTTVKYNIDGSVKSTNTVRTKEAVNEVVAVGTKSVVKSEVLSYKTVEQSDNSLAKGTTKVVTKGVNGSKTTTTTYTLDTATGLVTPHVDVKTQNPVDEVVAVGTAVAPEDKVTTAAVAFKTIYQADPNAIAGSKKVVTAGVNGVDTTTTSYNLDGSVKSTNAVRTKNPVDQVVAVGTKATTTTEILPYSTVKKTDDSLAKDATKVLTKGVNGSKTTTTSYTLNTATGEVTAHTDVKTTDPVNEVVAVGTAVAPEDKVTTKDVAYKTVYTADDTMAAGTKKTVTAGQSGLDTTTTTYNLDGSVKATNTVRTKNPVDEVVAVGTKSVVKNEILSYKYVEKEDPTLAKGEEKLISVGYNGKKVTTTTYTLDTQTGEVTAHTDVKTTDPVDAVLAVGTKEAPADLVTTAPVAYKTIYQANNDLAAGTKMVLTKGESGVDTTTTTYNLDGSVKSITTVHTKEAVSEVVAVGTKTEVSTEILQYKSVTKEDPTLKKGTTQKAKGGINGWATTTTTYTLDTVTGEVTAHKSVEKVDPVDEVVAVGTAEANPYTAEKIAKLKPMLLALVNQYRAEVGADPLTMDSTYDSILDARAAQKAKDEGTTGTYNHSGFSDLPDALNKEEATDGYVHGGESLGVGQFSLYASDEDQFAGILNYEKMTEDDEKADYQAIVIDKSRDYFKGPSQTYRHYTMMVDKKNTKVYIGVGTYVDENEDGWISVVFEFKP